MLMSFRGYQNRLGDLDGAGHPVKFQLADGAGRVDLAHTDRGVRAERRGEVHTIRSPSGDETFGVSNAGFNVLLDVALNVLPFTIAEPGVALCSKVDGINPIAPKDVGAESRQAANGLIVRSRGDLVGLEEMHARSGQFNYLSQIDRNQLF